MERDEEKLAFAIKSRFKYVMCDDTGNIKGYGLCRKTLEYHNEENLNIMTIRQYQKATEEK